MNILIYAGQRTPGAHLRMHNDETNQEAETAPQSNLSQDAIASEDSPQTAAQYLSECGESRPDRDEVICWPLVNGGVTKISLGDMDTVAQHVWRAVEIGAHTYAHTTIDHKRAYLHRLLCGQVKYWNETKGKWTKSQTDHKNGDTLDNSRGNLRIADHRQNQQNSIGAPSRRRSRFKGVAFCKNRKRRPWRAVIIVKGPKDGHGRQIHGGYFDSEEAAARRYNELARKNFGEFARLNDVDNQGRTKSVLTGNPSGSQTPAT